MDRVQNRLLRAVSRGAAAGRSLPSFLASGLQLCGSAATHTSSRKRAQRNPPTCHINTRGAHTHTNNASHHIPGPSFVLRRAPDGPERRAPGGEGRGALLAHVLSGEGGRRGASICLSQMWRGSLPWEGVSAYRCLRPQLPYPKQR